MILCQAAALLTTAPAVTAVVAAARSAEPPGDSATVPENAVLYAPINGPVLEPFGFATVVARSGPDGSAATGTFSFHFGGGNGPTWSGGVTCLSVDGNRAAVGVDGSLAANGRTYPFVGFIFLVDGGAPEPLPPFSPPWPWPGTFDPPDTMEFRELASGTAPTACPSPASPPPGSELSPFTPVLSNDVTVTDSPSKEQCKRGGWAAFGFRNQGQCVAAAQRGGSS